MILRPYQVVGRDWLASKRHALLADEMRVGKTPQAILAAVQAGARSVLVVCPAIAALQWQAEWRRWAGLDATLLDRGVWPATGPVIASYNRAVSLQDVLTARRWDLVILDEAHFAKNPNAQRTKAVYGKDGLAHAADRTWALSGTPAPKNASELWPLLRTFGATALAYEDFVARYCRVDALGKILGTKDGMIPELKGLLAPVMLRRTRREVAPDMPEIGYDFLAVRPANEADYAVPVDLEGDDLLAWLQAHRTEQADSRAEVALAKAPALVEEIREAIEGGLLTQTVVFGYHVSGLLAVAKGLRDAGVKADILYGDVAQAKRAVVQEEFRDGRLQVVVAQIIAAGTAIDLSAARHGYFLELDWVPGNNQQAANRLVNMDKNDPVTFDICSWPGSVDDRVQRVLARRTRELSQLF